MFTVVSSRTWQSKINLFALLLISFVVASCGGGGAGGAEGTQSVVMRSSILDSGEGGCEYGGISIDIGTDANGDGDLDDDEINNSNSICNGADGADGDGGGADGLSTLLAISSEGVEAYCDAGGQLINTGLDLNGDGSLDADEITANIYICDGMDGMDGEPGETATSVVVVLMSVTNEPAGETCVTGSRRIDIGADINTNGILDAEEITSTRYVCNSDDTPLDTEALAIGSAVPANNEIYVSLDIVITVNFTEIVAQTTINAATFMLHDGDGGTVDGAIVTTPYTAFFTPTSSLELNTTYTVTLTTGITDLAGNALAAGKTWSFSTAPRFPN